MLCMYMEELLPGKIHPQNIAQKLRILKERPLKICEFSTWKPTVKVVVLNAMHIHIKKHWNLWIFFSKSIVKLQYILCGFLTSSGHIISLNVSKSSASGNSVLHVLGKLSSFISEIEYFTLGHDMEIVWLQQPSILGCRTEVLRNVANIQHRWNF
jgi:hypothetical protein